MAGIRHSCVQCPIALAVRRAFNYTAVVDKVEIFSSGKVTLKRYHAEEEELVGFLPIVAMNFIKAFDIGLPVCPFEFVLPYETYIQFKENDCRLEVNHDVINDEPSE